MHKRLVMMAVFCLAVVGYATAQTNPQNPLTDAQPSAHVTPQPAASSADPQAALKSDAVAKNATAKPASPAAASPAETAAGSHAPVNAIKVPSGSRIYVAPMGGFENYVVAGILKKKVPVAIVADRNKADFEINGSAETQKAGWAKIVFMKSDQTNEQASIQVTEIKTGNVVFAYSVNKANSYKGKQSAGEAIGKHLNEAIGKD